MDRDLLLGIDLGTSRVKAVLIDRDGAEVGSSSAETPWSTPAEGEVEVAPDVLVDTVVSVVAGLGEGPRQRIAGAGIAGMAESGVALDAGGRPLSAVMAWHDRRGEAAVARLGEVFGDGLPGLIGQRVRTVLSVAKLGWLVGQGGPPPAQWLGVPELVLRALTGEMATEHSLAARTGCYDVGRLRWLPEVAGALGFGAGIFPDVLGAGTVMGRVTDGAAARWGVPAGVPVTIAGHDHLAGGVGAGATAGDLANSVGTAETVFGRHVARPDLAGHVARGLAVTVFPGPDGWASLASGARAGIVLTAAAEALGHGLEELDDLAEASATAVDAAAWAARLADARGDVARAGAPPEGEPGQVWRGLLDTLVARTVDSVERVRGVVEEPARLVVFGGGSLSRPWLRAKAAATDLAVWRSPVADAVARGAAVFGGVAAGWYRSPSEAPAPALEPVAAGHQA